MMPTALSTEDALASAEQATPMMQQFLAIKAQHLDALLFYRMGDFYELFLDDAIEAARVMDIALTHRGQHLEQTIPMCGVPAHSYETYLHKLIVAGHKVAICEQLEAPEEAKKRGAKSVVKRDVVRIVTPGTLVEENLLSARQSNYLAAIFSTKKQAMIAWSDISTGDFFVMACALGEASSELQRIAPCELLQADTRDTHRVLEAWDRSHCMVTVQPAALFKAQKGERALLEYYGIKSLESFGAFTPDMMGVAGALLDYICLTQKASLPRLQPLQLHEPLLYMSIDASTRRNLELFSTLSGEKRGGLLHTIDRTQTAAGARLLARSLASPLLELEAINARQQMVTFFVEATEVRQAIRQTFEAQPDMERVLSRLYMGRGGPRDLLQMAKGLDQAMQILDILEHALSGFKGGGLAALRALIAQMGNHERLITRLHAALKQEVPLHARDGHFIRAGYDATLDSYHEKVEHSGEIKQSLQDRYIQSLGIKGLKIKENNILGLYIEVNSRHLDQMPAAFIHRQTMASAVRYTTEELRTLEHQLVNAKGYALQLELDIFAGLLDDVLAHADAIALAAKALAMLDMVTGLAELAVEQHYCCPEMDMGAVFSVTQGRHPVVEQYLPSAEPFIANDCRLEAAKGAESFWLLTGPNMAGKSTFLRQNAVLAILAQMGSYVPAEKATIGVIDRVFSRVGASDNLADGQSTFMVEMMETATILHQATGRSLVILDEVGRGTATYDGLSIAWAVTEYLHQQIGCRTLFATHYHEMNQLAERLEGLACYTMKVREWEEDVIFMHQVIPGAADRSYGIHVGKLAGLPSTVLKRAQAILQQLHAQKGGQGLILDDLPLFQASAPSGGGVAVEDMKKSESAVEAYLNEVEVDTLTPREAMELLYRLKDMVGG